MDKIASLPQPIAEFEELKRIFLDVLRIANSILNYLEIHSSDLTDLSELKCLIDSAENYQFIDFGIQLEKIKVKYLEANFIQAYEEIESRSNVDISCLRDLCDKYTTIPSTGNEVMSDIYTRVTRIIQEFTEWNFSVQWILSEDFHLANKKISLESLELLANIKETNLEFRNLNLEPHYSRLSVLVKEAHDWNKEKQDFLSGHQFGQIPRSYSFIEGLISRGKRLRCAVNTERLEAIYLNVRMWAIRFNSAFAVDFYTAFEAVCPRPSSKKTDSKSHHQKLLRIAALRSETSLNHSVPHKQFKNCPLSLIEDRCRVLLQEEICFVNGLRRANSDKRHFLANLTPEVVQQNQPHSYKFCFCSKVQNCFVIQCRVCWDWFHLACVTEGRIRFSMRFQQLYLCPICARSKRPSLAEIQSLYESLLHLNVCFIEGELFKQFYHRVMLVRGRIQTELRDSPVYPLFLSYLNNSQMEPITPELGKITLLYFIFPNNDT